MGHHTEYLVLENRTSKPTGQARGAAALNTTLSRRLDRRGRMRWEDNPPRTKTMRAHGGAPDPAKHQHTQNMANNPQTTHITNTHKRQGGQGEGDGQDVNSAGTKGATRKGSSNNTMWRLKVTKT
jgi:hypothetical protein